jgi:hypothetical protein
MCKSLKDLIISNDSDIRDCYVQTGIEDMQLDAELVGLQ